MTVDELKGLVREYLDAEREHRSEPCLHRYRGIVRTREKQSRHRRWIAARTALEKAVAEPAVMPLDDHAIAPYRSPWRKVIESEPMPGWWNVPGRTGRLNWFITAECGHAVIRRGVKAPKRVRCEGCL